MERMPTNCAGFIASFGASIAAMCPWLPYSLFCNLIARLVCCNGSLYVSLQNLCLASLGLPAIAEHPPPLARSVISYRAFFLQDMTALIFCGLFSFRDKIAAPE